MLELYRDLQREFDSEIDDDIDCCQEGDIRTMWLSSGLVNDIPEGFLWAFCDWAFCDWADNL